MIFFVELIKIYEGFRHNVWQQVTNGLINYLVVVNIVVICHRWCKSNAPRLFFYLRCETTPSFAFIPFDVGSNFCDLFVSQLFITRSPCLIAINVLAPYEFSILSDKSSLPRNAADVAFAHSRNGGCCTIQRQVEREVVIKEGREGEKERESRYIKIFLRIA